ncbi:MAG: hypothetical protein KatS3mg009_2492 [Acidimicrobiia bacterium]|nr:MAG: hypothetical protein KatS3mg009_2492 [Acidimicrobiia bacterium]
MRRALPTLVAALLVWAAGAAGASAAAGAPVRPGPGDDGRLRAPLAGDHEDAAARAVARKEVRPTAPAPRSPGAAPLAAVAVLAAAVTRSRHARAGGARSWRCVPDPVRRRGPPGPTARTVSPAP